MRVERVAIIGAGPGGGSAAVWLAEHGVDVTLIEASHNTSINGQAVTFGPQMHRGIQELGLLEDMVMRGNNFDGVAADVEPGGEYRAAKSEPLVEGVRPMLTMRRQELHELLIERAERAGATYLLGVAFESLRDLGDRVEITLSDGSTSEYDLVIGADGIRSRVREFIAPDTVVEPLPQGGYRAVVDDVPRDDHPGLSYMGSRDDYMCGYIELHGGLTYVTIANNEHEDRVAHADVPRRMREILAAEVGEMARLRDLVTDELADIPGRVSFRKMETVMVDGPWHKGRAVLVGDAAHGTTPNLGLGAGSAMEDVLVLMRKLADESPKSLGELLDDYSNERNARISVVNRNSASLCRLQCEHGTNSPVLLEAYAKAAAEFDATVSPTGSSAYVDVFSDFRETEAA